MAFRSRTIDRMQRAFSFPMARELATWLRYFSSEGGLWPPQGGAGKAWFVDSNLGNDSNNGRAMDRAFASLDACINAVSADSGASRGDVIFVCPGHVEDLTNTNLIDLDVAGVTVNGLGIGTMRPRFDFNHADAIFQIGADNCRISNLTFRPSVTIVTVGVEVGAGANDCVIDDCEFLAGEAGDGTDEFVEAIEVEAGCTNTFIRGCKFRLHASAGGATSAIMLTGASTGVEISDCDIKGPYTVACINGDGAAQVDVRIRRNLLTPASGQPGIELLTASAGIIDLNFISTDLATKAAAIVADACFYFENYYCEVANETGGIIGTPSVDD